MSDQGSPLVGLLIGGLFVAVGLVLVTDFKGAASAHARAAVRTGRPLRRIPPWRWLPDRSPEQDQRFALRVDRIVGAGFLIAGLLALVSALVDLL